MSLHDHHADGCGCCSHSAPGQQSLDELAFLKSACAAAQQGNVGKLERILRDHPTAVSDDGVGGQSGYTPLLYAARAGHLAAVKTLLAHGAKVNSQTRSGGASALHRAAYNGHAPIVQLLLDHGADALLRDADGETALHKARKQGHDEVARMLSESCSAAEVSADRQGRLPSYYTQV